MQYTTFEQVVDDFEKATVEHEKLFNAQTALLKSIKEVANNMQYSDEHLGAHVRNVLNTREVMRYTHKCRVCGRAQGTQITTVNNQSMLVPWKHKNKDGELCTGHEQEAVLIDTGDK